VRAASRKQRHQIYSQESNIVRAASRKESHVTKANPSWVVRQVETREFVASSECTAVELSYSVTRRNCSPAKLHFSALRNTESAS
jgi:hypothetical protein